MAAIRSAEVVELLGRVPVFSTLERSDLERIAQLAVPRRFEPGHVVFREGDASDTCYIVREGHARAIHEHGDGRTITLATFGPGDIFGELAMFEDELRSATVEAVESTAVVAVLGPDMRRLMTEHPEISTRLVIALGRRLREANARLSRQSFQTVQSRVAVVLSDLVEQERGGARPDRGSAGSVSGRAGQHDVLVTATQADLAQLAGSSRESASRFLAVLERAGVISQGRGRLVVHDPEALKQYVF
jgi:CRP-like cAMP-binding protein